MKCFIILLFTLCCFLGCTVHPKRIIEEPQRVCMDTCLLRIERSKFYIMDMKERPLYQAVQYDKDYVQIHIAWLIVFLVIGGLSTGLITTLALRGISQQV
nr:MAG TPA: protein of unknown function (UPF0257) [Caudoviricetes sp.]